MPSFEQSFSAAEQRALSFLVDDYGFRMVDRSVMEGGPNWVGMLVRYRAEGTKSNLVPPGWAVTLVYVPVRLELSLDIAGDDGHRFAIEELHALVSAAPLPAATHSLYASAQDEQAQYEEFNRLAQVLKQCGARFFGGDQTLWHDLRERRERAWQAEEDRRALAESEVEFRAQNWHLVVAALTPREPRLPASGAARLAYARKRMQGAA
jgi:hypothetical protein